MKYKLKNKWIIVFDTSKAEEWGYPGWYRLTLGIYKSKGIEGERWGGKEKGFAFSFMFWLPFY